MKEDNTFEEELKIAFAALMVPVPTANAIPQPKVKEEVLTEEQYYELRPAPTGCPNGDSIPMEACFK